MATLCSKAEMTIETLRRCRTEYKCENLWDLALQKSGKVLIEARPNLEFQDPKTPRLRKVPMKLEASIEEEVSDYTMFREAIDNYRINT